MRRTRVWTITGVLGLLLTAAVVASCSTAPPAPAPSNAGAPGQSVAGQAPQAPAAQGTQKKLTFAMSTQDAENQYWIEQADEFKKAGAEKGVTVLWAAKYDPREQANIVQNFIQQGANAIAVSPVDPAAITPVFDQAKKQGILVINDHFPTDPAYYDVFVDTGPYESGWIAGSFAANYINTKLGGNAEVGVITLPENKTLSTRVQGITDAITQKAKGAKLIAQQRAQSQDEAVKTTQNMLTANPNIKVFVGWSDFVMLGSVAALEGLGKNPADFCIVGIDATPDAISAMMKGKMKATVDNPPRPFARLVFDIAYSRLTDPNSTWNFVTHVITKLTLVDETNMQEWVKKYNLK